MKNELTGRFAKIVAAVLLLAHVGWAQSAGDLDPTFGTGGKRVDETISGHARGASILRDGKILVAGYWGSSSIEISLARYHSDGSLDNSFGSGGYALAPPPWFGVNSFAVQANGMILVAGSVSAGEQGSCFGLARYTAMGLRDLSFGQGGVVLTCPTGYDAGTAVSVHPSGNIFQAGYTQFGLALANISTGQIATAAISGEPNSIAIQPDGKIVVAGGDFANYIAVRYDANGVIDPTFGVNGVVTTYMGSSAYSVAIQTDGKIVVAGGACPPCPKVGYGGFGLVRYNQNGSLDTSFDSDGKVETSISGIDWATSVAIQADMKIVAAGTCRFCSNDGGNFAIVRYNSNGSLDPSFAINGIRSIDFNNSEDLATGMVVDQQNRAVIVGMSGDNWTLAMARVLLSARSIPFDFDGDRKTDVGIFRGPTGEWWYQRSSDQHVEAFQFGTATDTITPADYTGDGKTDAAIFRPSTGEWLIVRSEDGSFYSFAFGTAGDVPAPSDYDGDGKADAAVFRPSTSTWFVSRSGDGGTTILSFGQTGDVPVTADYDGDGKSDVAIYRPASGEWWILRSSNQSVFAFQFGSASDRTVPADYTGDRKADPAFFRPLTGEWFVLRSEDGSFFASAWGVNGDVPAPGDYDGDGRHDTAIFRPSQGTWYVNRSTAGLMIQQFGISTDVPIANAFVR